MSVVCLLYKVLNRILLLCRSITIAFARSSEGQGVNRISYTVYFRVVLDGNRLMQGDALKV